MTLGKFITLLNPTVMIQSELQIDFMSQTTSFPLDMSRLAVHDELSL